MPGPQRRRPGRRARGLLPELQGDVARRKGLDAARALPGGDRRVAQRKLLSGTGSRPHGGTAAQAGRPRRGGARVAGPGAVLVHEGGTSLALSRGGEGCAPLIQVHARGVGLAEPGFASVARQGAVLCHELGISVALSPGRPHPAIFAPVHTRGIGGQFIAQGQLQLLRTVVPPCQIWGLEKMGRAHTRTNARQMGETSKSTSRQSQQPNATAPPTRPPTGHTAPRDMITVLT